MSNTAVTQKRFILGVFRCTSLHSDLSSLAACFALETRVYKGLNGGEGGIRTHGRFPYFGFQDRGGLC